MSRKRSMLLVFPKDPSTKDAIEGHLRSSGFEIKLTREVDLSPEQRAELHKRNAALGKAVDGQPAYAMVLEHSDAVARWTIVSRQVLKNDIYKDCYASASEAVAKEDILWLKGYLRKKAATGSSIPTAAGGSATPGIKNSKDSSKQHQRRPTTTRQSGTVAGVSRGTSGNNRSSAVLSSSSPRRTAGDLISATTPRQGSVRSESMTSASRRGSPAPSRVPVKASSENTRVTRPATGRKTTGTRTASRAKIQQQQQRVQEDQRPEERTVSTGSEAESDTAAESVSTGIEKVATSSVATADGIVETEEDEETQSGQGQQQDDQGELYPSDKGEEESEHDAEVAAATQHHHKPSAMEGSTTPSTLRASLSPNSITSLPRPETPEVDQLRQRFESLAHTSSPSNNNSKQAPRRSSGSSPENLIKIKDLKAKSPSGSRVKSMVEFFMDENLHKWEF